MKGRNERGRKIYSDQQVFDEWYSLESFPTPSWWEVLPKCPKELCIRKTTQRRNGGGHTIVENPDPDKWRDPIRTGGPEGRLHPGAIWSLRSLPVNGNANQCVYDEKGKILSNMPSAGTVDYRQGGLTLDLPAHWSHDVAPVVLAGKLDGNNIGFAAVGFWGALNSAGKNTIKYYAVRPAWIED